MQFRNNILTNQTFTTIYIHVIYSALSVLFVIQQNNCKIVLVNIVSFICFAVSDTILALVHLIQLDR